MPKLTQTKGFGKLELIETHQTFRVEYKAVDPNNLDDERDVETVLYKVPISKGTAEDRRYLVAATVACYFESDRGKQEGVNLAFIWNSEAANFDPICQLSSIPIPGAQVLNLAGLNVEKSLKNLSKKVKGI